MFNQGKPSAQKSLILRRIFYSLVFFSLLAVGCRSSSQAQIAAPTPTPTPAAENQCTPPNLPIPNKTAAQTVWKGKSGDYEVLWTTHNITATDNKINRTSFSLDKFTVGKTVEELGAVADWYCDYESYERSYKILSLVGSLMSLEETAVSSPQTYVTVKYRTVDLSNENRKPALTDYFPPKEVFRELIKNPIIKAAIVRRSEQLPGMLKRKISPPGSIDEFFKLFECSAAEKQDARKFCGELDFSGDEFSRIAEKFGATHFFIKSDLLNEFAFESLKNGKVTVQILIPAVTGNRNEEGVPVKLQLNISSSLKDSLAKANLRQDGFLIKDKNLFWKKDDDREYLSANIILASNR